MNSRLETILTVLIPTTVSVILGPIFNGFDSRIFTSLAIGLSVGLGLALYRRQRSLKK